MTSITTKRSLERVQPAPPAPPVDEQHAAGYRACERRWRDAPFFLVERRKGKRWMYGSIALAAALWTYVYLFVQLR